MASCCLRLHAFAILSVAILFNERSFRGKHVGGIRTHRQRRQGEGGGHPCPARNHALQRDTDALLPDHPPPGPPFHPCIPAGTPLSMAGLTRGQLDAEIWRGVESLDASRGVPEDEADAMFAEEFGISAQRFTSSGRPSPSSSAGLTSAWRDSPGFASVWLAFLGIGVRVARFLVICVPVARIATGTSIRELKTTPTSNPWNVPWSRTGVPLYGPNICYAAE